MVAIGEYELAVLKAVLEAGGATAPDGAELQVLTKAPGEPAEALRKLQRAEYLEAEGATLRLTDLALEYLEALGLIA